MALLYTHTHTHGCITLRLDFGLRREFSCRFVVADVTGPTIGSDFLCFYNLLFDMRHRRLIDNITNLTVNGALIGTYGGHIKNSSAETLAITHCSRVFRM